MSLLNATSNLAQELCKPALAISEARISEVRNLQRTWAAMLAADASRCSTKSGQFEIEFNRLKESAPDLQFVEHFTWAQGQSNISLDIWWDEWLESYRLRHVAPCPCRK